MRTVKRVITLLILVQIFKTLASCCNPPTVDFKIKIIPDELKHELREHLGGGNTAEYDSHVFKRTFVLYLQVMTTGTRVPLASNYFMSTSIACNDNEPQAYYEDDVTSLKIMATSPKDSTYDVTGQFGLFGSIDRLDNIEYYFKRRVERYENDPYSTNRKNSFELAFKDRNNNIEDGTSFEIEMTLSSGKKLKSFTKEVYFKE